MASGTLREIGRKLNISRFTVARVLRNEKYVSEKTRALVLSYLKKEPYVPNAYSAMLYSGKINIIGLVAPEDAFFRMEFYIQEIIKGVSEAAKKEGYHLLLFTQEKLNTFEYLKLHMSKLVAGFILPSVGRDDFKGVIDLKNKKVPIVILCSHIKGVSSFDCDNVTGGYLATKYLLDSGRKRIAFIHAHKNWVDVEDRFKGYEKALTKAGKDLPKDYVQYNYADNRLDYEKIATRRLLGLKNPPDAILVANDKMALAVMSAVKQTGRKIPQDIAVMGFDNIPSCENFSPALSTVSQPIRDMASAATKALVKIISSDQKDHTHFFKPKLIIRESA